ncbi:hypothetical protein JTB14_008930 [Gonioctena quinquepunctata]|nr:hypothetical protein JTB14_008930 [Gonioctena quinquepunctata]
MLKGREILETGKESKKVSNFPYRQAVGALMYLMLGTRPDLAYSIGFLSRSLENPTAEGVAKRSLTGTNRPPEIFFEKADDNAKEFHEQFTVLSTTMSAVTDIIDDTPQPGTHSPHIAT